MRRAHYQDGLSGREIARQFGISRDSVRKMLTYSEPPGWRVFRSDETRAEWLQSLKAFHNRGLMPTNKHRIYSFRHAFEKRMQEAGLDYGQRCTLMGHKNNRPQYGDGGSLKYRQKELLKIVRPLTDCFIKTLPSVV